MQGGISILLNFSRFVHLAFQVIFPEASLLQIL